MAKTTLNLRLHDGLLVDIESTEPLTQKEEEEVSRVIRFAFSLGFSCEPPPALFEIKEILEKSNPVLANKLTGRNYHY